MSDYDHMAVLEIIDLHVQREGKQILKGVNLKTGPGEVHAQRDRKSVV